MTSVQRARQGDRIEQVTQKFVAFRTVETDARWIRKRHGIDFENHVIISLPGGASRDGLSGVARLVLKDQRQAACLIGFENRRKW